MYVGNKHTVTAQARDIKRFRCTNCRYEGYALVTGVGQGQGNSPYFMDEKGAANRAQGSAHRNARKNIDQTLQLAKCPKCFQRNRDEVNAFWTKQLLKLFGGFGFIALIGGVLYSVTEEDFVLIIFGVCALVVLPLIYFTDIRWRWETVDSRVIFLPDDVKPEAIKSRFAPETPPEDGRSDSEKWGPSDS